MTDWTRVAAAGDLKPGDVKQVHAGGDPLCLANVEGEFLATTDICSHEYVNLSEGWLENDEIECPQHGSKFSMRTGQVLNAPATQPIAVYEVRVEDDAIYVRPRHDSRANERTEK